MRGSPVLDFRAAWKRRSCSVAPGKVNCTKDGTLVQTARASVARRLNGSPEEATVTFNDGTKVLVVFPKPEKAAP